MKYVVAAGYGGTGAALARRLAPRGHQLLLLGRNGDKLAALCAEIDAQYAVVDLTHLDAVEAAVNSFGPIDGIVNCAGSILLKPAHITSEAEFQQTLDTNLKTAFVVLRAGVKNMPGGGSVVLISTAAARMGYANHEAIAAAKGGIEALVRSAAATYAAQGLRINAVAPGMTDTPLTAGMLKLDAMREAAGRQYPLGGVQTAAQVADVMAWLLGPGAARITGQVIPVDGGFTQVRPLVK